MWFFRKQQRWLYRPLAPMLFSSSRKPLFSQQWLLADLMYVAKDLIGLYYETDIALAMLVGAYLIMLLPHLTGL